jgi:hypothetical protein
VWSRMLKYCLPQASNNVMCTTGGVLCLMLCIVICAQRMLLWEGVGGRVSTMSIMSTHAVGHGSRGRDEEDEVAALTMTRSLERLQGSLRWP